MADRTNPFHVAHAMEPKEHTSVPPKATADTTDVQPMVAVAEKAKENATNCGTNNTNNEDASPVPRTTISVFRRPSIGGGMTTAITTTNTTTTIKSHPSITGMVRFDESCKKKMLPASMAMTASKLSSQDSTKMTMMQNGQPYAVSHTLDNRRRPLKKRLSPPPPRNLFGPVPPPPQGLTDRQSSSLLSMGSLSSSQSFLRQASSSSHMYQCDMPPLLRLSTSYGQQLMSEPLVQTPQLMQPLIANSSTDRSEQKPFRSTTAFPPVPSSLLMRNTTSTASIPPPVYTSTGMDSLETTKDRRDDVSTAAAATPAKTTINCGLNLAAPTSSFTTVAPNYNYTIAATYHQDKHAMRWTRNATATSTTAASTSGYGDDLFKCQSNKPHPNGTSDHRNDMRIGLPVNHNPYIMDSIFSLPGSNGGYSFTPIAKKLKNPPKEAVLNEEEKTSDEKTSDEEDDEEERSDEDDDNDDDDDDDNDEEKAMNVDSKLSPVKSQAVITIPSIGKVPKFPSTKKSKNPVVDFPHLFKDIPLTNRSCKCGATKCLKLYCECFHSGTLCDPTMCTCKHCHNTEKHNSIHPRGARVAAIVALLAKKPNAFSGGRKNNTTGCRCKKSGCVKKYCECVASGKFCGSQCTCVGCKNQQRDYTTCVAKPDGAISLSTIGSKLQKAVASVPTKSP